MSWKFVQKLTFYLINFYFTAFPILHIDIYMVQFLMKCQTLLSYRLTKKVLNKPIQQHRNITTIHNTRT